jgi:signal transduction histidine kinase
MGVLARLLAAVGVNATPALGYGWRIRPNRISSHDDPSTRRADASGNRQRLTGQLAGGIMHDLNNLLATILGCLELMERRLDDPERLKALIERSSNAVDRAARLTSRLAQFARRQSQTRVPTDANALVNDLAPLLASALGRRVRLCTKLSPESAFALSDPAELEATLLAVCLAARAALPETGQIAITTHVEDVQFSAVVPLNQRSGSALALSVTATGRGLIPLDLHQARCIAALADVTIQLDQDAEDAKITILLPSAAQVASPRAG